MNISTSNFIIEYKDRINYQEAIMPVMVLEAKSKAQNGLHNAHILEIAGIYLR